MKYRLSAQIVGWLHLSNPRLATERDGILFELHADNSGRAISAAVTLQVPADRIQSFKGSLTFNPPGTAADSHLSVGGDKDLRDRLLLALQEVESSLANVEGQYIREVQWLQATDHFIAESPEEEALLSVDSFTVSEKPPERRVLLYQKAFEGIVAKAPRFESLFVHRAIWREAMNAFEDGKQLYAILWFWFIIEDLFAGGHTGKKQVLRAFRADTRFRDALAAALEGFKKADKNYLIVEAMFARMGVAYTVDGAAEFLFHARGNVLHFSSRAEGKITPHNQRDFRPLALFFMHIANIILIYRVMELNRRAAGMPPLEIPTA